MCQNAEKTVASLMAAIEPTLKNLLAETGNLTTDAGKAAIAAFDAALATIEKWTPGSVIDDVLQGIGAFQTAFQTVMALIPPPYGTLINIILAGIEAVLGVIKANSPAPAPATTVEAHEAASPEEIQAHHAAAVAAETEQTVHALVPQFKRSIWHSAASQYKKTWNEAVLSSGLPQGMQV